LRCAQANRADETELWRHRNLGKAFYENPSAFLKRATSVASFSETREPHRPMVTAAETSIESFTLNGTPLQRTDGRGAIRHARIRSGAKER
jgi:hypothetical protein